MPRLIFLDAGPLSVLSRPVADPIGRDSRVWLASLLNSSSSVVLPEIADYEVRRELERAKKIKGLARPDVLVRELQYAPITTSAMRRAARLWADIRSRGLPTAGPDSLDADCILAAQAIEYAGRRDELIIATTNRDHLRRFQGIKADLWENLH